MGNIYVLNGEEITELCETPYENENLFQSLIARCPNLLASDQINPADPRQWIFISREMGVPGESGGGDKWSLDLLFADQDAIPTFVEVKRSTDTRIRREVVAQMLDYAANGSEYWAMDKIRLSFEKSGGTLDDINTSLDEEEYWRKFESNLRTGKIRLIFAADAIPMELRRIIEFLNDQMQNTEVLGIEIKQYTSDGAISTLVPRVVGQTAKAMDIKNTEPTVKIQWTEDMFMEKVGKVNPESCEICQRIINAFKGLGARSAYSVTTKSSDGGIRFWYERLALISLYAYTKVVIIEVRFMLMKPSPFDSDEKQREIIERLNAVPGIAIDRDKIHKLPSIDVAVLADHSAFDKFIEVFTGIVNEYKGVDGDAQ